MGFCGCVLSVSFNLHFNKCLSFNNISDGATPEVHRERLEKLVAKKNEV